MMSPIASATPSTNPATALLPKLLIMTASISLIYKRYAAKNTLDPENPGLTNTAAGYM